MACGRPVVSTKLSWREVIASAKLRAMTLTLPERAGKPFGPNAPLDEAVMVWVLTAVVEILKLAWPLAFMATARTGLPSLKGTVPLVTGKVPLVTVAVMGDV